MVRLAHVSDLHFGTEAADAVKALQTTLHELAVDVVIVSGDLTQRAKRSEFAAAKHFLDALECPIVTVPGNHDIPLFNPVRRALRPFSRYRESFGSTDTRCLSFGHVRIVAVNSVRRERHAEGRITLQRRLQVAAMARAAGVDEVTLVVVHHPPFLPPPASKSAPRGRLDARACDAWKEAGVRLILSGHVHRPFLTNVATADEPTTARGLWVLGAGTTLSKRVRDGFPNSCNIIDIPSADDGDVDVASAAANDNANANANADAGAGAGEDASPGSFAGARSRDGKGQGDGRGDGKGDGRGDSSGSGSGSSSSHAKYIDIARWDHTPGAARFVCGQSDRITR